MADTKPATTNSDGDQTVASAEGTRSELPEYIERYRVERLLGHGGLGIVYLALDERIDQLVVVKVPRAELVSRPEHVEAYLAEARRVASLKHPHIVPVLDQGSTELFPCFIVSRYVAGVELGNCGGPHNPTGVAKVFVNLAEALDYAHRKNSCHLNLRPGKILLDSEKKPWLLADDFMKVERLAGDRWIPGNPRYFSPEQLAGEEALVGPLSDIYSLGVVLYQMLTGRSPYRSDSGPRLVEEMLAPSIRPPSTVVSQIPAGLDRVCMCAMARAPDKRYQSMKDLADELRTILG